jgi:starvation-inducible DNA-binding protein
LLEQYPIQLQDGADHVLQIVGALAKYGQQMLGAISASGNAGDAATSDLFTEISRAVDDYLWKVEAHNYAK